MKLLRKLFNGDTHPDVDTNASSVQRGALYWFNWHEISDSGYPFYGRYVFQYLMPFFAPQDGDWILNPYIFYNGNCLPKRGITIPGRGADERRCVEEVQTLGLDACYVVAVYCFGQPCFNQVDIGLRARGLKGVHRYIGMTSFFGDASSFIDLTAKMSLVPTLRLDNRRLSKQSFHFLNDGELRSMGFEPVDVST